MLHALEDDDFALLRRLLSMPPSPLTWDSLTRHFAQWKDPDERAMGLAYADAHMGHWPDGYRILSYDPATVGHAAISLARVLRLEADDFLSLRRGHGKLQNIRGVVLSRWHEASLKGLDVIPELHSLELGPSHRLADLDSLAEFSALRSLKLQQSPNLHDIQGLQHHTQLRELHLADCRNLLDIGTVAALPQLEKLYLNQASSLEQLPELAQNTRLEELYLRDTGLRELGDIEWPESLKVLDLGQSNFLEILGGFDFLPQLEKLSLNGCRRLSELRHLHKLRALQNLSLQYCQMLRDLSGIQHLNALEKLNLLGCWCLDKKPERGKMFSRMEVKQYQRLYRK